MNELHRANFRTSVQHEQTELRRPSPSVSTFATGSPPSYQEKRAVYAQARRRVRNFVNKYAKRKARLAAFMPQELHRTTRYIRKHYLEYPILGVLFLTVAIPVLQPALQGDRYDYKLAANLLTDTPQALQSQIDFDAKTKSYTFTPAADEQQQDNSQSVGGAKYSASLAVDAKQGISMTDTTNKLSLGLIPDFDTLPAKQIDHHIVYPVSGSNSQLVYTFKGNGLKEDILLYSSAADEASFSYKLDLPRSLEARLLDDGSIGIYGGDPALFGKISYGSDADKQLVEKAQARSTKNTLMYVMPAPVVKGQGLDANKVRASFALEGSQLTVRVSNLVGRQYPLTIDPSLVLANSSDWAQGEGENIDLTASGQISRGELSGGELTGSFTSSSPAGAPGGWDPGAVVWNGYIYIIGGQSGNNLQTANTTVYYAPITASTGAIGTWTSQSLNTVVPNRDALVYDGKIYCITNNAGSVYFPINNDASLGSAVTVNAPPQYNNANWDNYGVRQIIEYNGYIYVNRYDGSTGKNSTVYVKINPDGSLGTWAFTVGLPNGFDNNYLNAYNGYIYSTGGGAGGPHSFWYNTTYYTKINSDGSLATCSASTWCTASNNFTTAREGMGVAILNGYIYIMGGCASPGTTGGCNNNTTGAGATTTVQYSDIQYAPIYANGDIGPWKTSSKTRTGQNYTLLAAYNHLYAVQGTYNSSSNCPGVTCVNTINFISSVDYIGVTPAGETSPFASAGSNYTTARTNYGTSAYNGYLYVFGGTDSAGSTFYQDVQYTQISSTGALTNPGCGTTWCATTNMPNKRNFIHAVAYNGYMYLSGGNGTGLQAGNHQEIYYSQIGAGGALGAWTSTNAYSGSHVNYGFVQSGGYLYLFGGWDGSANLQDCQYAKINGPAVAAWSTCTNMPGLLSNMGAAASGGYIYYAGGANGAVSASNVVYYAKPTSTGNITSWTAATNLPAGVNYPRATISNGVLYVVGGIDNGGTNLSIVQYAPLNSDGSITQWYTASQNMSSARAAGGAESLNGYLYAIGNGAGTTLASTEYATINNGGGGTLNTWASTSSLNTGRYYLGAAAYNGYLYAVGGATNGSLTTPTASVEYAAINSNGTLGTWTATTSLPNARYGMGVVVANGYLYSVAGNDSSTEISTVNYAQISSTGALTGGWQSTTSFPSVRRYSAVVTYGKYIYVMGGTTAGTASNAVYYALSTSTGALAADAGCGSAWCSTTSFTTARQQVAGFQYNGYLYILGGYTGSAALSDVQYAKINANGTVGTWNTTSSIQIARFDLSATAVDGFVYLSNSDPNTSWFVTKAPILASGQLGAWESTADVRAVASKLVAVPHAIYAIAGYSNSVTVSYSAIKSQVRTAQYTKLFTTDKDTTPVNLRVLFTGADSSLMIDYANSKLSTNSFGTTSTLSMTSATKLSFSGGPLAYYRFTFLLDDSDSSVFPDNGSTPTTITYLKFNYHPNTSMRLRGGGTFNSNSSQSLDAP